MAAWQWLRRWRSDDRSPDRPIYPISFGLDGAFEFTGRQVIGWVRDSNGDPRSRVSILMRRGTSILSWIRAEKQQEDRLWRFAFDINNTLTARDFLSSSVEILAIDPDGGYQMLNIDGAAQLALIREVIDEAVEPYLSLSFGEDGNTADFVRDGWSFQEPQHRWTINDSSTIAFIPPSGTGRYTLEFLLWPFTVPDHHPEQRLEVSVNDELVGIFFVRQQTYLKCKLPPFMSNHEGLAIVRFVHPDGARPCDFQLSNDERVLSFAFKKLRIVPAV